MVHLPILMTSLVFTSGFISTDRGSPTMILRNNASKPWHSMFVFLMTVRSFSYQHPILTLLDVFNEARKQLDIQKLILELNT